MAEPDQVVEPGSEPTPTPAPAQSQQTDSYKVTIDGKEQTLTLSELTEYAQKGGDYTKKTQELATQRKNLEPMEELFNFVRDNPDVAPELDAVIKNHFSDKEGSMEDGELLKQVSELKAVVGDLEMDRTMTTLEGKYKDSGYEFDRQKIAEYCIANRINDPETGFIKMIGLEGFEKAAKEKAAKDKKSKEHTGLFPPKPGIKTPPGIDINKMSDQEKDAIALKALRKRG